MNPAAFFRLSSGAKCCHKHVTLPRIVFIFLALLSFLCGNAFGYARSHSLASPAAKATHSTNLATLITDHCSLTTSFDFGWDAKNQLVRARTKNHSSAAHAYDLTFTHDAEGRRVQKHVVEYQHGAVVSEKFITFVWDGWDLLYERHQLPSGLTTLERKYLWGPDIADGAAGGAGGLLLIQETKGNNTQKIIPLYDGTGHVTALTNLNKDLLASYAYGPFGEKITANGPLANSNPWRWATKYFDEETGLYYFGKRYLDPVTGQWLSRELLGESESLNLYYYCHNDPVNRVDVLGLAEVPVDMMDKYIQDKLIEEAHLELLEVISSKDDSWLPDAERIERQNIRVNLLLSCQYQLYQSNRQATWISPSSGRPIVETAALCVGGVTNQTSASLNSVFINPIGAEMFALKGLGGIVGISAKEACLTATFGKAVGQIPKVSLVANIAKELETGAMLAKADAAFMQSPEVRQLLSASMTPVRPSVQFVSAPSRAQLAAAKGADEMVTLYHGATSNAGSKIVEGGFRQADTFFAEEMATSRYFAGEAAARTGARSTTSIEFTMPRSVAEDLGLMQRRLIGADRNLPTPDIDFGTGFERILPSGNVSNFNSLMEQSIIFTRRKRH